MKGFIVATKVKVTNRIKRKIQVEALRALHDRGHFTAEERHAGIEADRCSCGGIVWGTNLLCNECVMEIARKRQK